MNSQAYLSGLQNNAQICQITIRCALEHVMCSSLRAILQNQLREYDGIEMEAFEIAHQRGWDLAALGLLRQILSDRSIRIRLFLGNTDSRIAELMIKNRTNLLIDSLRGLHQYNGYDSRVRILSQKTLDCAADHIRQLQPYL